MMIGEETLSWVAQPDNVEITIILSILVLLITWLKGRALYRAYVYGIDSISDDWNHVIKLIGCVSVLYFLIGEASVEDNPIIFTIATIGAIVVFAKFSNSIRKQVGQLSSEASAQQ